MAHASASLVGGRFRLGLASAVLLIGLLTVLWDGTGNPRREAWQPVVRAVVAGVVLLWLLEAAGLRLPRLLLAVAVASPVAWLISIRHDDLAPLFLFVLVAWVHLTGRRRDAVVATVLGCLALVPMLLHDPPSLLTWGIGVVAVSASTAALLEQWRLLAELRAAQADLAREAAAAERRRIAREVHDLIAHSLSVTMLHLTAARHVLQRDPARAAHALAEAERLGRESLADVRRTVGLLDAGAATGAVPAPVPTAAEIPTLIEEYRRAGLTVTLDVQGDLHGLPAATGLALYRIVQEALANVVKHARGARAEVTLMIGPPLVLRVRDDGPPGGTAAGSPLLTVSSGAGLGLPGMRERARLLGGTLRAGRDGDGWLVECVVPAAEGTSEATSETGAGMAALGRP